MTTLLHRAGLRVDSVFGLHGTDENDLSAAFAFGIASSDALLKAVLQDIDPQLLTTMAPGSIHIQTPRPPLGVTDVEMRIGPTAVVVFEAKKGAQYPSTSQLARYAKACRDSGFTRIDLVALTSHEPSEGITPTDWSSIGVPVCARSWRWLRGMVRKARQRERSVVVKYVLSELLAFLEGFMGLERAYSNMVYVVSLGSGTPPGWTTTWIDIVEKYQKYFYPVSHGGWPPPPNYFGFRYGGRLHNVRHVEGYQIVEDVRPFFPGAENGARWEGPYYLFEVGPAMRPAAPVLNGRRIRRAMRVWCMLDLLLTSATISDALADTQKRIREAEGS